MKLHHSLLCVLALALLAGPGSARALTIIINPDAGLAANQPALDAFNRAAAEWSSALTDPITVTIAAGLDDLNSNTIIGQTNSVQYVNTYSDVRDHLIADSAGNPNRAADLALPTAAQFRATLPANYTLSGDVAFTQANAKAIGYTGFDTTGPGATDATITFNTRFNFSYGTTPVAGLVDFQTTAAHEIGHALGFFSDVDDVDQTNATAANPVAIDLSVLDLFRFKATAAPTGLLDLATAPRDLTPGSDDVTSDGTLSLRMSTGKAKGDGNQASHWKDDNLTGSYIGLMDPTLSPGVVETVTQNDLFAMNLIGYDLAAVPEPGTWVMMLLAAGALGCLVLRRQRRQRC